MNILDASSKFLLPSNTFQYSPAGDVVRVPEYSAWVYNLKTAWPFLLAELIVLAASLLDFLAVVHVLNRSAALINSAIPDVTRSFLQGPKIWNCASGL